MKKLILFLMMIYSVSSFGQVHRGYSDKIKMSGDTIKVKVANGSWRILEDCFTAAAGADSNVYATKAYRDKLKDSLGAIIATKAGTSHGHAISDVTGLQSAIDGKAASSHSHAISDVTSLQASLDAKAPLASPTFTGTVSGITASMVGLGNVTNESKATMFTSPTLTGTVTLPAGVSLTTPVIGAATGTSLAVSGTVTSSGTAGIGYATGAGGTVTQATSKSTGVTLNKVCGTITLTNAALAASTTVSFTLTNSTIAAGDVLVLNHASGGTAGSYTLNGQTTSGGAIINVRNVTLASLGEAIVIRFVVIKGVTN